jgi:hypothetical protein
MAGYVDLWTRVHRAEEALIEFEPRPQVIIDAIYDDARLARSSIDQFGELVDKLRLGIRDLDPNAADYLLVADRSPRRARAVSESIGSSVSMGSIGGFDSDDSASDSILARAVIRSVRRAINQFRDGRRDALIRLRQSFTATVATLGVLSFVALALAVELHPPARVINAALGLFLVGALAGLFHRLYTAVAALDLGDDFGFGMARLLHMPLCGGLTALAGSVALALVIGALSGGPAPGAVAGRVSGLVADPIEVLQNPINLLVGALFGLLPGYLLQGLDRQAAQYVGDLGQSSAASSPVR